MTRRMTTRCYSRRIRNQSQRSAWWPGYSWRLRKLREWQHQVAADGGPCWRMSDFGRAAQLALTAAVNDVQGLRAHVADARTALQRLNDQDGVL